jgi:hypothetical protein
VTWNIRGKWRVIMVPEKSPDNLEKWESNGCDNNAENI